MSTGAVPGVTILGGQATFGSSDGSLEFEGGPALGQVDAKVKGGPVLRTLAAIYAFGLADNPVVDNVFNMPPGPLAFPGAVNWGARYNAAVTFSQKKANIALASPPAFERVGMAGNISGSGGSGAGFFRWNELNDPDWSGAFAQLNLPWLVEGISFSNDDDTGPAHSHTATEFARRLYDPFAASPIIVPAGARIGGGLTHHLSLYNQSTDAIQQVDQVDGYGMNERYLLSKENGANAQWVTHWNNAAAVPAAGDGPCWVVDGDGRFSRLAARAAIQAQQSTGLVDDAWGWSLQAWNGTTFVEVANFTPSASTVRGVPIATIDSASTTFETPLLDGAAAGVGVSFTTPIKRAGFYFIASSGTLIFYPGIAGVATSSLAIKVGNDAGHTNIVTLSTTAGSINAIAGFAPIVGNSSSGPTSGVLADDAVEATINWAAVTGVTALPFKFVVRGTWLPI